MQKNSVNPSQTIVFFGFIISSKNIMLPLTDAKKKMKKKRYSLIAF